MRTSLRERLVMNRLAEKLHPLLSRDLLRDSMHHAARWLHTAQEATGQRGKCYRSATLLEEGEVQWTYPNSNTSEVISAWLQLSRWEVAPRGISDALDYALALVDDPVQGFYRGEQQEAHGMAWYWTDDGTYTGGYSMRAPAALIECARHASPDEAARLHRTCLEIGETFLARQLPNGFVNMVGWCPERGWLSERMAGSRYGYCVATFATLWKLTGDDRYHAAYEKALEALLAMQQPEGFFYQHYDPTTLEPMDTSIKVHFFSYLFNAIAEAHSITSDTRLLKCAQGMAGYLSGLYAARHQLPYCVDAILPSDTSGANSATQDSANGLLWLYETTGEPLWLDIGTALWFEAWQNQPAPPAPPGWFGAIPIGNKRCDLWFLTNYIFATTRLERILRNSPLS